MRFATPLLLAALASAGLGQTTTRVSVSSAGLEANSPRTAVTISESGRWVAMQSAANNLVLGDTNGTLFFYQYDCVLQCWRTGDESRQRGGCMVFSYSRVFAIVKMFPKN